VVAEGNWTSTAHVRDRSVGLDLEVHLIINMFEDDDGDELTSAEMRGIGLWPF